MSATPQSTNPDGEDDEIIAEIRRNCEAFAAEHGNDLTRMLEELQRQERGSGRVYVTLSPRKPRLDI